MRPGAGQTCSPMLRASPRGDPEGPQGPVVLRQRHDDEVVAGRHEPRLEPAAGAAGELAAARVGTVRLRAPERHVVRVERRAVGGEQAPGQARARAHARRQHGHDLVPWRDRGAPEGCVQVRAVLADAEGVARAHGAGNAELPLRVGRAARRARPRPSRRAPRRGAPPRARSPSRRRRARRSRAPRRARAPTRRARSAPAAGRRAGSCRWSASTGSCSTGSCSCWRTGGSTGTRAR